MPARIHKRPGLLITQVFAVLLTLLVVRLLLIPVVLGQTAPAPLLHEAVREGDIAQVRVLLQQGADANAKDAMGVTPLHLAVLSENKTLATLLLERGASIHARTQQGETPLHVAAAQGRLGMAEVLVAHGADVNAADNLGRLPLKLATLQNHQPLAHWLRTQGAELARDWEIELGTRKYRLSVQAQAYLTILGQSKYQKTRSVLIIEEPHFNATTQWALYKGLEQFFRDHPRLPSRTMFLAEGAEAGRPLSVEPLIKATPHPDEPLIRVVLRSFLIPAYMAYAWKYHQYGIPILGTEDRQLYDASAALWTANNILVWQLSVVARNKSLAQTLIDHTKRYENPILFAGGLHLEPLAPTTYEVARELGTTTMLQPEQLQYLRANDNLGIADYLRRAKIGYTFMSAMGHEPPDVAKRNEERYRELFQAQQHGGYSEYINKILPHLLEEPGITVRPAPEAAAQLIHALADVQSDENDENEEEKDNASETDPGGKGPENLADYKSPLDGVLEALRNGVRGMLDLIQLLPKEWIGIPTKKGGGTRYADPERPGDQIRFMPGNPKDPAPIKQGPYVRISKGGQKFGPFALEGNPTLP